ncbi:hypothetical protein C8J47_0951 [Sphingomonas sp. PP-F2F-G114-C0414]|nr:hypothetical protein C8J47_0951 [Sphingomonas sp. PP-F2F-G114-C0414]
MKRINLGPLACFAYHPFHERNPVKGSRINELVSRILLPIDTFAWAKCASYWSVEPGVILAAFRYRFRLTNRSYSIIPLFNGGRLWTTVDFLPFRMNAFARLYFSRSLTAEREN